MATHDIIVIGASAGGVEAISGVVAGLPRDIRASILIVLHLARGRSVFPDILTRVSRLPAAHPFDGQRLEYGRIYVAPPDHHMTIHGTAIRLNQGPIENGVRPAVDPLFRSAARSFGARVVGVVLSGSLDDGTAGLAAIKQAGGIAVVQDPAEAFAPGMPRNAVEVVQIDHVLPLGEIGPLLVGLTRERVTGHGSAEGPHLRPMEPDRGEPPLVTEPKDRPGQVSVFTCPECNGTLWEADEAGVLRFRCRVGHVYTAESMMAAHADSLDRALWAAVRSLEERAALTRKLAQRARSRNHEAVALGFEQRAAAAENHADLVRHVAATRTPAHQAGEDTDAVVEGPTPSEVEAPTRER